MTAEVGGFCEPGFERVREAFARGFAELGEVGAATALYVDGRAVVDLWGGVAHPDGAPVAAGEATWQRDTLVGITDAWRAGLPGATGSLQARARQNSPGLHDPAVYAAVADVLGFAFTED